MKCYILHLIFVGPLNFTLDLIVLFNHMCTVYRLLIICLASRIYVVMLRLHIVRKDMLFRLAIPNQTPTIPVLSLT